MSPLQGYSGKLQGYTSSLQGYGNILDDETISFRNLQAIAVNSQYVFVQGFDSTYTFKGVMIFTLNGVYVNKFTVPTLGSWDEVGGGGTNGFGLAVNESELYVMEVSPSPFTTGRIAVYDFSGNQLRASDYDRYCSDLYIDGDFIYTGKFPYDAGGESYKFLKLNKSDFTVSAEFPSSPSYTTSPQAVAITTTHAVYIRKSRVEVSPEFFTWLWGYSALPKNLPVVTPTTFGINGQRPYRDVFYNDGKLYSIGFDGIGSRHNIRVHSIDISGVFAFIEDIDTGEEIRGISIYNSEIYIAHVSSVKVYNLSGTLQRQWGEWAA